MELRYSVPYGTMLIHGEAFFREAGKHRVRKLLKDYKASSPPRDETDRLEAWLSERIHEDKEALECLEGLFFEKSRELKAVQAFYEYSKNACDDKECCQKAKDELRVCRTEMKVLSADISQARRNLAGYTASLEEVCQILKEEWE